MAHRIYLVEDHPIMREMIGEFLTTREDLVVSGTAATALAAFRELEKLEVEVVLVDTALPNMNGIELVRKLLARRSETRCLMYSGHTQQTYVRQALEAGARGYVVKGSPRELVTAIHEVVDGGTYLSRKLRRPQES